MPFLPLILGHLKLAGYTLAILALIAAFGYVGHLRSTVAAQQSAIAVQAQQLTTAKEINNQNLAALERLKAANARNEIAVAEAAAQAQTRTAALAKIRQEVHNAAPSPNAVGPAVSAAVLGLRNLKTARIADKNTGGKGANPSTAPVVPR